MTTGKAVLRMALGLVVSASLAWADGRIGPTGRLERLEAGGRSFPVQTELVAFLKGWRNGLGLSEAADMKAGKTGDARTWQGTLKSGRQVRLEARQSVEQAEGRLLFYLSAKALADSDLEGVCFLIQVPTDALAGGWYSVGSKSGPLPVKRSDPRHLCDLTVPAVSLTDAKGRIAMKVDLDPRARVLLQDDRKLGSRFFSAAVFLKTGSLSKGQQCRLKVRLSWAAPGPVQLTMDAKRTVGRVAGIGGNFYLRCDEVKGVPRYNLDNLDLSMARLAMWLDEWEPVNDDADPRQPDDKAFAGRDRPGSPLRRDFEFQRELARRKIPYVLSVFCLPAWMYTKPPKERFTFNNRLDPKKWPELLERIGTYLQHAKDKYGAEPDYFSFNEPGQGVYVGFSAQEHRRAIKTIGAHLSKLGFKTKLLLGDNADFQGGTPYVMPAARDPEAMKYVGALSFHSYLMKPGQYRRWALLAKRLKLPLLAGEVGVDPNAAAACQKQDYDYALRELAMYQEIFLHARPQAMLYWEYGGSCWSLLRPDPTRPTKLKISERFCFQKHWCDFIRPGSDALATSSDSDTVLFTAFRHPDKKAGRGLTLNVANLAHARRARIGGLPKDVGALRRVQTSQGVFFRASAPLAPKDGRLELDLPARSLVTLTTLPAPGLK